MTNNLAEPRGASRARLTDMAEAGGEILECYRLLRKGGGNIVAEVLRGHETFFEREHYPPGDVYDDETHAQYYYHAHPDAGRFVEHGHFHTFLRPLGMPAGVRPAVLAEPSPPTADGPAGNGENDALSHLVAISMDSYGFPVRLFTTNQWVTGEVWYAADDVRAMLDRFAMDLAYPSLPVNIWITAMIRLFRPQIERLISERDARIAAWQDSRPGIDVFEDRDLDVVSSLEVSVPEQLGWINDALHGR